MIITAILTHQPGTFLDTNFFNLSVYSVQLHKEKVKRGNRSLCLNVIDPVMMHELTEKYMVHFKMAL